MVSYASGLRLARAAALAAAFGALAASAAQAQTGAGAAPRPIGTFKDWSAYVIDEPSRKVCFIVSEPKSKTLSDPKAERGDPFFLVTRWGAGQAPQPSVIIGYPQDSDSRTKVKIGSNNFEMFVENDGAWMETEDGDNRLTQAMRAGSTMTVEGVSARGTKSTDRYSLAGISAALDEIAGECK